MNIDIVKNLVQFGLNEKLARVYLAGLSIGPATATQLAKISEVKRGTIYGIIKELKILNLCTESRKNKTLKFLMSSPNEILAIQNDRNRILEHLLPTLLKISLNPEISKVNILDNIEEIKNTYMDCLKSSKMIYSFGNTKVVTETLGIEWAEKYIRERKKRKIVVKVLEVENAYSTYLNTKNKFDLRQMKMLPADCKISIDIEMYDNKIFFVSLGNKTPLGVLIEDRNIANSFKNIFELVFALI